MPRRRAAGRPARLPSSPPRGFRLVPAVSATPGARPRQIRRGPGAHPAPVQLHPQWDCRYDRCGFFRDPVRRCGQVVKPGRSCHLSRTASSLPLLHLLLGRSQPHGRPHRLAATSCRSSSWTRSAPSSAGTIRLHRARGEPAAGYKRAGRRESRGDVWPPRSDPPQRRWAILLPAWAPALAAMLSDSLSRSSSVTSGTPQIADLRTTAGMRPWRYRGAAVASLALFRRWPIVLPRAMSRRPPFASLSSRRGHRPAPSPALLVIAAGRSPPPLRTGHQPSGVPRPAGPRAAPRILAGFVLYALQTLYSPISKAPERLFFFVPFAVYACSPTSVGSAPLISPSGWSRSGRRLRLVSSVEYVTRSCSGMSR
jgi:hypothetical protein